MIFSQPPKLYFGRKVREALRNRAHVGRTPISRIAILLVLTGVVPALVAKSMGGGMIPFFAGRAGQVVNIGDFDTDTPGWLIFASPYGGSGPAARLVSGTDQRYCKQLPSPNYLYV